MGKREGCPRCGEKEPNKFHKGQSYCIACKKAITAEDPTFRQRNRQSNRQSTLRKKYGLTEEDYDRKLLEPCEICGTSSQVGARMVIDHHVPGSYEGVLCAKCNAGIGFFDHDPEKTRKATVYLERTHRE